jgi:uncharacterized membrane protein YccC
MAWRTFVSVVATLAVGYALSRALGQPIALGMAVGGALGFITGLTVAGAPILRMGRLIGWTVVPVAVGLGASMLLAPYRPIALIVIVPIAFLHFYLDRLGPYGHYFGLMLFAYYLIGLLQPTPLSTYPQYLLIGVASAAACIVVRALLCPYNPARAMRQTQRAYHAASRRAANRIGQLLETGRTPRGIRRLDRALEQVNTVALAFDGRLAHPRIDARLAERLHRSIFDHEYALVTLAAHCRALPEEQLPSQVRELIVGQVRRITAGLDGNADLIRDVADTQNDAGSTDPGLASLLMRIADALDSYRISLQSLHAETYLAAKEGVSFAGVVALEGAMPAGVRPLAQRVATSEPRRGRWRINPRLSTRNAIQAAVAMAIALPIGDALNGAKFYWAAIGVMIIVAGTNTTHERGHKVVRRLAGTIVGAVLGIGIHSLIGSGQPWWFLTVVVLALTVCAYAITVNYPMYVACLVIALTQVYALGGVDLPPTLLYRLAENGIGAVTAAVIAVVVLRVSTYSVIRAGLSGYQHALETFAADLAVHLTDPNADVRIHSDVRAVDHALFQFREAVQLLPRISVFRTRRSANRYQRAKTLTGILAAATDDVHSLAQQGPPTTYGPDAADPGVWRRIEALASSISDVQRRLDGYREGTPAPGTTAIADQPAETNADNDPRQHTLTLLSRLTSQLSLIAPRPQHPTTHGGHPVAPVLLKDVAPASLDDEFQALEAAHESELMAVGRHELNGLASPNGLSVPGLAGTTVSGHVRHIVGGPAPDAVLTLINRGGQQVARGTSGADGSFRLVAPLDGVYVLIASLAGHQPQAITLRAAGEPVTLYVLLTGAARALGVVHTANRRPVSGATVTLTDSRGEVVGSVGTATDGAYVFTDLFGGSYTLVASAIGYQPYAAALTVPSRGDAVTDVELSGVVARLSGRATSGPDQRPVQDARVTLVNADGNVVAMTTTDESGDYTFGDLPEGNYTLIVSGYPPVTSHYQVGAGQDRVHEMILSHAERRR